MPTSLLPTNTDRGRNREDLREHNLSAIAGLLHKFGTLSRAQLTSSTGLNRTTISNLVSELKDLGLVYESQSAGPTGVGRPSVMVSLSADVVAFAVNTALDATTVGVVSLLGQVLVKARRPNPANLTPTMAVQIANDLIIHLRAKLSPGTRIIGIGVAIPGQVRVAEGLVRFAPAFKWINAPFGPMLNKLSNLPVFLDNDASLGCLAERTLGSARKYSNIVYLFGGTNGVGGGVVIDGLQLRGASGYANLIVLHRISRRRQGAVDQYFARVVRESDAQGGQVGHRYAGLHCDLARVAGGGGVIVRDVQSLCYRLVFAAGEHGMGWRRVCHPARNRHSGKEQGAQNPLRLADL